MYALTEDIKEEEVKEGEDAVESKQDKALNYLQDWKNKTDEWKFKKNYHIWLLKSWKLTSVVTNVLSVS